MSGEIALLPHNQVEWLGLVAILTTSIGVWLRWQRVQHLSDIEEAVKNSKLQPDEAQRRARLVELRASGLVAVGLLLLLITAFGWSE